MVPLSLSLCEPISSASVFNQRWPKDREFLLFLFLESKAKEQRANKKKEKHKKESQKYKKIKSILQLTNTESQRQD